MGYLRGSIQLKCQESGELFYTTGFQIAVKEDLFIWSLVIFSVRAKIDVSVNYIKHNIRKYLHREKMTQNRFGVSLSLSFSLYNVYLCIYTYTGR